MHIGLIRFKDALLDSKGMHDEHNRLNSAKIDVQTDGHYPLIISNKKVEKLVLPEGFYADTTETKKYAIITNHGHTAGESYEIYNFEYSPEHFDKPIIQEKKKFNWLRKLFK